MIATVLVSFAVLCQLAFGPAIGPEQDALRSVVRPLSSSTRLSADDKQALRKAIGKSRVVFLGELTHGDGTSFEIKTELVKFLHGEMGFDALVWESGLYDCSEMDADIGTAKPLTDVARSGVFSHWSTGAESFPVFTYARDTRKTKRPLTMAGFDIQNSGTAGFSMFPDIYGWFKDAPELSDADRAAVDQAFQLARTAGQAADPQKAMSEAVSAVNATASRFFAAFDRGRERLTRLWGPRAAYRAQVLKSAVRYAEMLRLNDEDQRAGRGLFAPYILREQGNAENLAWLLDHPLKGKKVIVWAHNVHVFKGLPGLGSGVDRVPGPKDLDAMGRLFAKSRPKGSYTLGFVAYEGSWSWLGNPEIAFDQAKPGSLEATIHGLGHPLALLDLKALPKGHRLRTPMRATIDRQNPFVLETVWPDGFDGLVYIDRMRPRVQMKAGD